MLSSAKNVIRLCCCVAGLWLLLGFLTPRLLSTSAAWQRYSAVQDEYGLSSGDLYYTDVPVTQDAESAIRDAVQAGMRQRG